MGEDDVAGAGAPMRLMNFVSEEQLESSKSSRGERVEDGSAHRDRPLFQILKENKDKQDADFNLRFKHMPPKALDEDETQFLDTLHTSRKQYEQHIALQEAQQLRIFQEAVAAHSIVTLDARETPRLFHDQEKRSGGKKKQLAQTLGTIIKVKPLAKKAKVDISPLGAAEISSAEFQQCSSPLKTQSVNREEPDDTLKNSENSRKNVHYTAKTCLVSYSDDDEEDNVDD